MGLLNSSSVKVLSPNNCPYTSIVFPLIIAFTTFFANPVVLIFVNAGLRFKFLVR